MKQVLRSIAAILAGLLAGSFVIWLVELMIVAMFDLPAPGAAYSVGEVPMSAFVAVTIGWFVGTALGSYTTCRLCGPNPGIHAAIVSVFFCAGGVYNLVTIEHPVWMWPAALLAFAGGGWTGARWARTGTDSPLGDIAIG